MPEYTLPTFSPNSISREAQTNNTTSVGPVESAEVINVVNMSLPDALSALSEIGFTNITNDAKIDSTWSDARWIVVDQSKEEGAFVPLNEKIKLSCKKICQIYFDVRSESNLLFTACTRR